MTQAPELETARRCTHMEDALRALRGSGRRVTRPARMLLEALFAADEPAPAVRYQPR